MLRQALLDLACAATAAATVAVAAFALLQAERLSARVVARRLGWRGVLFTAWLGVPVHELSHLAAAWLFRHRVISARLFEPDPSTGTLGYVWHGHTRPGLWQLSGYCFIGLAPLAGGGLALLGLLAWILPGGCLDAGLEQARALAAAVAAPRLSLAALGWPLLRTVQLFAAGLLQDLSPLRALQLYLLLAVCAHMAPSGRDLRHSLHGAVPAALLAAGAAVGLGVASLPVASLLLAASAWALLAAVAAMVHLGYAAAVVLGRDVIGVRLRGRAGASARALLPRAG